MLHFKAAKAAVAACAAAALLLPADAGAAGGSPSLPAVPSLSTRWCGTRPRGDGCGGWRRSLPRQGLMAIRGGGGYDDNSNYYYDGGNDGSKWDDDGGESKCAGGWNSGSASRIPLAPQLKPTTAP